MRPASRFRRRRGSSSTARRRLNVSASPKTDAVSAVVSGVRRVEEPERLGEVAVQPVTELVRQREHRATVARVVHEDVRVHARDVRRAEGAGPLAVARRRVDPALVEEPRDDRLPSRSRSRRRRRARAASPRPTRPASCPRRAAPYGRRRETVEPEQLRLQRVVALNDVVAADDRVDERLRRPRRSCRSTDCARRSSVA